MGKTTEIHIWCARIDKGLNQPVQGHTIKNIEILYADGLVVILSVA